MVVFISLNYQKRKNKNEKKQSAGTSLFKGDLATFHDNSIKNKQSALKAFKLKENRYICSKELGMDLCEKKKEFQRLLLSGKYTQTEISQKLQVSRVTVNQWVKTLPATSYIRIRKNLIKELDRLSQSPQGNEEMIFKYIQNLDILDRMIRKAKYIPEI